MVGLKRIILFFICSQLGTVISDENVPKLTVKIGAVDRGINISAFDVSQNEIVVDRGNTVQFICEGDDDLEWEYGEGMSKSERYQNSYYKLF